MGDNFRSLNDEAERLEKKIKDLQDSIQPDGPNMGGSSEQQLRDAKGPEDRRR